MNVCVYCSSSDRVDRLYLEVATELGRLLGDRKNNLVFGGGSTGPMHALAVGAKEHGARVLSVIPKLFDDRGLTYDRSDEVAVTADLQERRMSMIKNSDGFIALPGGFGTMEEISENVTMRQLDLHQKPIVLVNPNGFWSEYLQFLDRLQDEGFIQPDHRKLVHVVESPCAALDYLDNHAPLDVSDKWGGRS